MPSRASYSYVFKDHTSPSPSPSERDMNVEDESDRKAIIMAAQLSRIVCRKMEVDAYTLLQKTLNQWPTLDSHGLSKFLRELGSVLLTLRWRVSWWTLLGDVGLKP